MDEEKSKELNVIDLKKQIESNFEGYISFQRMKISQIQIELDKRKRWKKDAEEILKEFKKL